MKQIRKITLVISTVLLVLLSISNRAYSQTVHCDPGGDDCEIGETCEPCTVTPGCYVCVAPPPPECPSGSTVSECVDNTNCSVAAGYPAGYGCELESTGTLLCCVPQNCDDGSNQCEGDGDCSQANECQPETCEPTGDGRQCCESSIAPDGTACDDENACTTPDTCTAGECAGTDIVCPDDGNDCTTDTCDLATGECGMPLPNGMSCDDSDLCTETDTCTDGVCEGTATVCPDDGDPCTTDTCDPATGECGVPAPNGTSCDDGDLCTETDSCTDGVCEGTATVCPDDGNDCTTDTCDLATGECGVPAPDGTGCDDGDACTTPDTCTDGTCSGPQLGNGSSCDDGNDCTDPDTCTDGTCSGPQIGNGTSCDDGNDCTDPDSCTDGTCSGTSVASGTACGSSSNTDCDDPDTCDGAGACQDNYEPGTTVCRADAGQCDIAENCNGAGACPADVFELDGTYCVDGNDSNNPDQCNNGVCEGTTLVELSLFEAVSRKGRVMVHWVTESEKDTAGFDIERSLIPNEGYEKVNNTMIAAKGDELTGADYSLVDKNIKREKYYYKLKEYELTGKVNYYGPTDIDLRPQSTTTDSKTTTDNEEATTDQPPLVTEISGDIDVSSLDEEKKKQYILAGRIVTKTVKKHSDSPNTWIKSPFRITNKKGNKGRAYNGYKNKTAPTLPGQETPGPAKIISWLEKANVTYVSQRNFSHKDQFIKLLEGKVIVVNKTNPEYFRFASTIVNEEQLIKRLDKIGIHNTKSILTIWRESHENRR